MQNFSIVPLSIGWIMFATEALERIAVAKVYGLPLMGLPLVAILCVLSLYTRDTGRFMRAIAGVLAIATVWLQMIAFPGIFSSLLCITAGILLTTVGFATEQKAFFLSGLAGLGFGLLYHLRYAADLYTLSPWLALAVLGVVTVMTASYVEKNFFKIAAQMKLLGQRFGEWR